VLCPAAGMSDEQEAVEGEQLDIEQQLEALAEK
jgi:hypothetical protein